MSTITGIKNGSGDLRLFGGEAMFVGVQYPESNLHCWFEWSVLEAGQINPKAMGGSAAR